MKRTEWPLRTAWCARFCAIIVFARPCGATSTMLRASAMKPTSRARSTMPRSILVGQAQSKSAIGLKRPMWLSVKRRSRLRLAWSLSSRSTMCSSSCTGLHRSLVARATRSSSSAPVARSPRSHRRWARSLMVVLRLGPGEPVVATERVRRDPEVARAGVVGPRVLEGRRRARRALRLIEDVRDRLGRERAAPEGIGDRRVEGWSAESVQELEQPRGVASEVPAAQRDGTEEGLGVSAGRAEPVTPAELVRVALSLGEGGEVRGVLHDLKVIVGATVTGHDAVAVHDAHFLLRRDEGERLLHEGVRDGVVVAVEADVRRLARHRRPHEIALEGMLREGEQARPLLGEGLGDEAAFGVAGHPARVGDRLDPGGELGGEVIDRGERAGLEEGVSQIANGPLDLALLVSPVGRARLGGEVVVARQLEQAGMKVNEVPLPLEDSRLEVVIEKRPRHATEGDEGAHVALDEALQGLVEGEVREHGA